MQRRVLELDALRGVMLLWITVTHLPTVLSPYVNQPFGFVSASEGFTLLAAAFTGLVFSRTAEREGAGAMCRKLWRRAARLYVYHLLLVAAVFTIVAPIAARGGRPAVRNLLDHLFTVGPAPAFLGAALLVYRPPLLDILPIYIVLLALSPLALLAGSRLGWRAVLAASGGVWLLAQLGLRAAVHGAWTGTLGVDLPLQQAGAFDLWAWQLWWFVGLWLGVRWARDDLRLLGTAERIAAPAAVVAVAFLALRYAQLQGVVSLGRLDVLLDKWRLGPGRMVDFAAIAAVAYRLRSSLRWLAVRPLVMLGQVSLDVFCVHLVCVFCALTAVGSRRAAVDGWAAVALVLSSWSALFVASAVVHGRRAARRAGVGTDGPPPSWRGTLGWGLAGAASLAAVVLTAW
jgi:hypothetical protein